MMTSQPHLNESYEIFMTAILNNVVGAISFSFYQIVLRCFCTFFGGGGGGGDSDAILLVPS